MGLVAVQPVAILGPSVNPIWMLPWVVVEVAAAAAAVSSTTITTNFYNIHITPVFHLPHTWNAQRVERGNEAGWELWRVLLQRLVLLAATCWGVQAGTTKAPARPVVLVVADHWQRNPLPLPGRPPAQKSLVTTSIRRILSHNIHRKSRMSRSRPTSSQQPAVRVCADPPPHLCRHLLSFPNPIMPRHCSSRHLNCDSCHPLQPICKERVM